MSAPDPDLVATAEHIESAAFASLLAAGPPATVRTLGLVTAHIADAWVVASRALERRMYNHVHGLGVHGPVGAADLDAIERFFRGAGAKSCRIALPPSPRAAALATQLAGRGFVPADVWQMLTRESDAPPPPRAPQPDGLLVRELGPADAHAFGELILSSFPHPDQVGRWFDRLVGRAGWHVVGAFDGAALVATGTLFASGTSGWLGLAATRPTHRRRGAQSALIAARIAIARRAGIRTLSVETVEDTREKPNPSTHNLRRLGFRDLYLRPNWVKVLRED